MKVKSIICISLIAIALSGCGNTQENHKVETPTVNIKTNTLDNEAYSKSRYDDYADDGLIKPSDPNQYKKEVDMNSINLAKPYDYSEYIGKPREIEETEDNTDEPINTENENESNIDKELEEIDKEIAKIKDNLDGFVDESGNLIIKTIGNETEEAARQRVQYIVESAYEDIQELENKKADIINKEEARRLEIETANLELEKENEKQLYKSIQNYLVYDIYSELTLINNVNSIEEYDKLHYRSYSNQLDKLRLSFESIMYFDDLINNQLNENKDLVKEWNNISKYLKEWQDRLLKTKDAEEFMKYKYMITETETDLVNKINNILNIQIFGGAE